MNSDKQTNQAKSGDFIPESTENIIEGAKIFSEKASDIFNSFIEKVKEATEKAYDKGSQIYESVSLSAQQYVERFKDRSEMAQLKDRRDEVAIQLGYMCFMEYSGRYRFRVEFMKSDEFRKLMSQMRQLEKEIIQLGEKLESED
jgi:hypothetical protein